MDVFVPRVRKVYAADTPFRRPREWETHDS